MIDIELTINCREDPSTNKQSMAVTLRW